MIGVKQMKDHPIKNRWTQTYPSGNKIYFDNPDPNKILITDIAHQLALTNRYAGATKFPYSVAQHCVLMSEVVPDKWKFYALMHDSPEYICQDLVSMIKNIVGDSYQLVYKGVEDIIYRKYGLPTGPMPQVIKTADLRMLATEKKYLSARSGHSWHIGHYAYPKSKIEISEWSWQKAERTFLKRFYSLYSAQTLKKGNDHVQF